MPNTRTCPDCDNDFVASADRCPHCGRPGYYPNVYAAEADNEVSALEHRYRAAKREAFTRGAGDAVEHFEAALGNARAVIARPEGELQRLITSDQQLYATYYQLSNSGVMLPAGDMWDKIRRPADDALFAGYKEHIRFGALSLNGTGVMNYGDCFIVLRTDMIAHRASVFEENSVLFMNHQDIRVSRVHELPPGYRATWWQRARLCVAKLAARIDAATPASTYSSLLLRQGATSADDDFVEVHIYGQITIRTVEEITFSPRLKRRPRQITNRANRARLAKFGVKVR